MGQRIASVKASLRYAGIAAGIAGLLSLQPLFAIAQSGVTPALVYDINGPIYQWPNVRQNFPNTVTFQNVVINGSCTGSGCAGGGGGNVVQNTITAGSYTLSNANNDCGAVDHFNSSSQQVITVPTGLISGSGQCIINMVQEGAGNTQIIGGSGFTLKSYIGGSGNPVNSAGQYATFFTSIDASGNSGTAGGQITAGPFSVNNTCQNFNGSSSVTITCTLPNGVAAGDTVVLFGYFGTNTSSTISATDDKSDSCTTDLTDEIGGNNLYYTIHCPNLTAGAKVFTMTYTLGVTPTDQFAMAAEFGNIAASPLDGTPSQNAQSSPGTGTNAVTSGNTTTTVGQDAIVSGSFMTGGSQTANPGTNFSSVIPLTNQTGIEFLAQQTAGAIAGTWTPTGTGPTATFTSVLALKFK